MKRIKKITSQLKYSIKLKVKRRIILYKSEQKARLKKLNKLKNKYSKDNNNGKIFIKN